MAWYYWKPLVLAVSILAAGHALLNKRDPRSSLGWMVTCLAFPIVGPILYVLLGINYISRRGRKLRRRVKTPRSRCEQRPEDLPRDFRDLAAVSAGATGWPLLGGNRVQPFLKGDEAFESMLAAIDGASRSVRLASYIFDVDEVGRRFVEALGKATDRGLDVRVLVDGIGGNYSRPTSAAALAGRGVRVARFLPPRLGRAGLLFNMRNHRKLLIVDEVVGFTGGMNITEVHRSSGRPKSRAVADAHFRIEGPVVAQMEEVFLEDWAFCTGEAYSTPTPLLLGPGQALCRGIAIGPGDDLETLEIVFAGALAAASREVLIMTPYFLPTREMQVAMSAAVLRGVSVEVLLPGKSDARLLEWATKGMLPTVLARGVKVYFHPPPFVHTKLMMVDGQYTLLGSANWDTRSLRLNFEMNVEVYDEELAGALSAHFRAEQKQANEVTGRQLRNRPLPARVRDALARLASPYL